MTKENPMLSPGITGTYRQRATHTLRTLRTTIAAALCSCGGCPR